MKYNILLILLIILTTLMTSCRDKIQDSKTYTIKGQLLKNCGGEVMGNVDIEIQSKQGYSWTEGVHIYDKTDNEGNFSITYSKAGGDDILFSVNSLAVLEKVPLNKDIDFGIIYYAPTCNFVFKVVVDNPYSATDTLFVTDYNFTLPYPNKGLHIIPGLLEILFFHQFLVSPQLPPGSTKIWET